MFTGTVTPQSFACSAQNLRAAHLHSRKIAIADRFRKS
jgi:hypothetical protein